MHFITLTASLLAAVSVPLANAAEQEPLDSHTEACPDYASYATYPQSVQNSPCPAWPSSPLADRVAAGP